MALQPPPLGPPLRVHVIGGLDPQLGFVASSAFAPSTLADREVFEAYFGWTTCFGQLARDLRALASR